MAKKPETTETNGETGRTRNVRTKAVTYKGRLYMVNDDELNVAMLRLARGTLTDDVLPVGRGIDTFNIDKATPADAKKFLGL